MPYQTLLMYANRNKAGLGRVKDISFAGLFFETPRELALGDQLDMDFRFRHGQMNMAIAGEITREDFEIMAVAINTGTNIPSIGTPNGQAAFLFLLTSALAPLIRLSYFRMVWMAVPYLVTMTTAAVIGVLYFL